MEFQADNVAAYVAGGNNLLSGLRRVTVSNMCFNTTIALYNTIWAEQQKVPTDLYADHLSTMQFVSASQNLPMENGLPVVHDLSDYRVKQRVSIKDQWASHPTYEECAANLAASGFDKEVNTTAAASLLRNFDRYRDVMTKTLFAKLPTEAKESFDNTAYQRIYLADKEVGNLPAIFQSHYEGRWPEAFNTEELAALQLPADFDLQQILSAKMPEEIAMINNDIAMLTAIENKQIDTKTFDYEGQKYKAAEAKALREALEKALEARKADLVKADHELYAYYVQRGASSSPHGGKGLKEAYSNFFELLKLRDEYFALVQKIYDEWQHIFRAETVDVAVIKDIVQHYKRFDEVKFKQLLKDLVLKGVFDGSPALRADIEKYMFSSYSYFAGVKFFDDQMALFYKILNEPWDVFVKYVGLNFKGVLEKQAEIK